MGVKKPRLFRCHGVDTSGSPRLYTPPDEGGAALKAALRFTLGSLDASRDKVRFGEPLSRVELRW